MSEHRVIVPDLEMGAEPIVLSLWLAKRGRRLRAGDPVVEILCGVATVDLPAPVDGVLAEKLVGEGDTLQPGQAVAVLAD